MAKTKLTPEQLEEVTRIQERDGITRKSAIRKYQKQLKDTAKRNKVALAKTAKTTSLRPVSPKQAQKSIPGISRAAGLALYKLAGRPKRADFLHVYGAMGGKWTWEQRAKAVGLPTAKMAATQFPAMLKKPAESCLVAERQTEATPKAVSRPAAAKPAPTATETRSHFKHSRMIS